MNRNKKEPEMKIFPMFLLLAAMSPAAPVTTQIMLANAGTPLLGDGHYYVGPYTVKINGVDYAALCVDFLHEASVGTNWNVYINDLSKDISHSLQPRKCNSLQRRGLSVRAPYPTERRSYCHSTCRLAPNRCRLPGRLSRPKLSQPCRGQLRIRKLSWVSNPFFVKRNAAGVSDLQCLVST